MPWPRPKPRDGRVRGFRRRPPEPRHLPLAARRSRRRHGGAVSMASTPTLPPRNQIGDDTPLRLDVAAALEYPDGSMTASGLRREAARGRLVIERTAGKDYTTRAAIREMRRLCQLSAKVQGSGCGGRAGTNRGASLPARPTSSSTVGDITPKDALRAKLIARSESSPSTS